MCIFIASHAAYVEIKISSGYSLPVLIEMIWYGWPNESISKWALVKESICMICVCTGAIGDKIAPNFSRDTVIKSACGKFDLKLRC